MDTDKELKAQAYIDNEMSIDERILFEAQMKSDPELLKEVSELIELNSDLFAAGHDDFKIEVQQWEGDYTKNRRRSKIYSLLAIAASIVIVFFIANFYINQSDMQQKDLYAEYFSPYQDMILTRGEPIDSNNLLFKGMTAYNEQDYAIASELLEQYRINNKNNKAAALYLALSQTELGRFEPAERNFNVAMSEPLFEQQAQWYLTLMYIKKNDNANARSVLNTIRSNADHYKAEAADELYDLINN